MDGLRRRGAAALTGSYLSNKKEEIQLSIRKKFRMNSDSDIESQNNPLMDDEFRDEATSFPPDGDSNDSSRTSSGIRLLDFTMWSRMVLLIAGITLVSNILIMVGHGVVITLVAGLIASLIAVTVAVIQLKMDDIETLREVQNGLRKDVNVFWAENSRLEGSIEELNVHVLGLKDTEQRLKVIAKDQNLNVKTLVQTIDENQTVIEEMKKVIRYDIISGLFDATLKGERDESGEFSDKEIKRLLIYMRGLPAVEVNEKLLQQVMAKDRSISAVMTLVMDIGQKGVQEGDHIFIINEKDEELQRAFLDQ